MTRAAKLGELIELNPSLSAGVRAGDGQAIVPFLAMSAVSEDGSVCYAEERLLGEVLKGYTSFRRGDVLVAKITPCFENGKAAHLTDLPADIGFGSTEFHVLRPGSEIDGRYLFHMVHSVAFRAVARRGMTGSAGQKRVPAELIRSYRIDLPSLVEQRRIAELLDRADAVRRKREEGRRLVDELLRSVFLEMFGDPVRNEKGWEVVKLGDVTECLDSCRRPVKASQRMTGPVPYYGANGQQGWIEQALFDEPLILVAEDGGHFDVPERGVAYRIDGPSWVNNHAHVLRPRAGVVDFEYLFRMLEHFDFLPYISGTTRAKLTQGQMNSAVVPLPPMLLQQRFAVASTSLNTASCRLAAHSARLKDLAVSLEGQLLGGELQ